MIAFFLITGFMQAIDVCYWHKTDMPPQLPNVRC
jgi:hypothetical protein